jgi:RNA polymerase sigma-70 factor (ECF subfamily)
VIGDYLPYMNKMDSYTLEDLMQQYGQDVWNFAYLLTTNRSMADDITQDVFLQVYQHVATFRGEASVKTWLLRITRNISYNYRKSAFIRKVLLVDVIVPKGNSHSAEQSFLDNEAANEVWRQVFKLPTKFREVLILNVRYELSMQEIAGLLRIPEGTVKSRLHTARKRLLILLKEGIVHAAI